jgi:CRISPR/Cas system-associated protein endoribonuclease Cas2
MQNIPVTHQQKQKALAQATKTFLAKGGEITMLDHGVITQLDNGFKTSQKKRLERLSFEGKGKA